MGPRETVKCNPGEFCFQISQVSLFTRFSNDCVSFFVFLRVDLVYLLFNSPS